LFMANKYTLYLYIITFAVRKLIVMVLIPRILNEYVVWKVGRCNIFCIEVSRSKQVWC